MQPVMFIGKILLKHYGALDWTMSATLSMSTSFQFQTSDISRALVLHVGFR